MKLYKAATNIDVLFVSNEKDYKEDARDFLNQEANNFGPHLKIHIEEITEESQIPEDWKLAIVWGIKEDLTPIQVLGMIAKEQSEEIKKARERIVELENELRMLKEKVGT